jgi:hypothetical protein
VGVYGRIFAAGYEHWTRAAERAGLRDHRARLLAGMHGDVVEIGPGPCLNFPYYPEAVTSQTLAEPEDAMADKLGRRSEVRRDSMPRAVPLIRPLATGTATAT